MSYDYFLTMHTNSDVASVDKYVSSLASVVTRSLMSGPHPVFFNAVELDDSDIQHASNDLGFFPNLMATFSICGSEDPSTESLVALSAFDTAVRFAVNAALVTQDGDLVLRVMDKHASVNATTYAGGIISAKYPSLPRFECRPSA
ncbi:MAG TPA: hypothetical protein VGE52_08565 [Pirellulales bacterium]